MREKNNIRDVGSTADFVLVLLVHLVHRYLVHGLIGTSGALHYDASSIENGKLRNLPK